MKNFKRVASLIFVVVMTVMVSYIPVFAEVPDDLPEGTIEISEGLYYLPAEYNLRPYSEDDAISIGTIPAIGTILQPSSLTTVPPSGATYMFVATYNNSQLGYYFNLVSGTQNVFGSNYFKWPHTTSGDTMIIELDYYNIRRNVTYNTQFTSMSSNPLTNCKVDLYYN